MKPSMKYLQPNSKKYLIVASLLILSCNGPDDLDLVNIESEVITFQEDAPNEKPVNTERVVFRPSLLSFAPKKSLK